MGPRERKSDTIPFAFKLFYLLALRLSLQNNLCNIFFIICQFVSLICIGSKTMYCAFPILSFSHHPPSLVLSNKEWYYRDLPGSSMVKTALPLQGVWSLVEELRFCTLHVQPKKKGSVGKCLCLAVFHCSVSILSQ